MNLKFRIKLNKVKVIVLFWVVIAVFISLYDHLLLLSDYTLGRTPQYSFVLNLSFNILATIIGSTLGGIFLIFILEEKSQKMSYGKSILLVSISYVIIVSIVTIVMGTIYVPMSTDLSLLSKEEMTAYVAYLLNPMHAKNILFWSPIVALTQFVIQVDNKFGKGVLLKFILGKYKNPRQEMRIFMFLDLKSSTEIAEKLGNEKYHNLLKDFFADITNAIIYNKGEVYQYVGDEVVVSWMMKNGIDETNCVKCFFDIKQKIDSIKEKYLLKYGLVPDFKAGLHYGNVIAGEIGIIKTDITYSGDVLNTTARIQSMCNELETDILVSNDLISQFANHFYNFKAMGNISLRGKKESIPLSTIVSMQ